MYLLELSKQARKDKKLLKAAKLDKKASFLLSILEVNPFQTPPLFEKMVWDLHGHYSRRINDQHRLVYDVIENEDNLADPDGNIYEGIVRVKRMWTHYE